MKKILFSVSAICLSLILFTSCEKAAPEISSNHNLNLPAVEFEYGKEALPSNFMSNSPGDNVTTDAGATLGRVLFYDKALSLNNTVSCGSCHLQSAGFADHKALSDGFDGVKTQRNSMAIVNLGHTRASLFWDNREVTLEDQALRPIKNHIEMGIEQMGNLEKKLEKLDYYPALFENAFGTNEITDERISKALSQFMRSIVSYQTKYDQGLANGFANFSEEENLGRSIFHDWEKGCVSCHGDQTNLSGEGQMANIGLEEHYTDKGLGELTGHDQHEGIFKIPSLRNIALTAPYMHDGRFQSLEEVVDHYSDNVVSHKNLDWRLTDFSFIDFGFPTDGGEARRLNLSAAEKAGLVAFLKTLTDEHLLTDERFSDPFIY